MDGSGTNEVVAGSVADEAVVVGGCVVGLCVVVVS